METLTDNIVVGGDGRSGSGLGIGLAFTREGSRVVLAARTWPSGSRGRRRTPARVTFWFTAPA